MFKRIQLPDSVWKNIREPTFRREALLIFIITMLLMAGFWLKQQKNRPCYIQDEKGQVTALKKAKGRDSCPVHVRVKRKGVTVERDITILFHRAKEKRTIRQVQDPKAELEADLASMIRDTESHSGWKLALPQTLPDGSPVVWKQPAEKESRLFPALAILLLLVLYGSLRKKEKDQRSLLVNSVRRSLPAFNDQLLMLMECGLIFRDAYSRIARGYELEGGDGEFFRRMILECETESVHSKRSLVTILNERSDRYRIREFSRIVGYITDNQYRGVDLRQKLESSGRELWEERKKLAEEKGKLAETRLTMPLALLLLVLILVTAAPAILQVKGG